ncbi:MAG: PqqD family protein [Epsilonproteobacteria bacterium]|nr:PqqD family protein [Campylobacterota bacterium]
MNALSQLVFDENGTAFHPTMGNSYQLNAVALDIVSLLREGKTKSELLEILQEKYDVEPNELFIDVSDFIAKLKVYGLFS